MAGELETPTYGVDSCNGEKNAGTNTHLTYIYATLKRKSSFSFCKVKTKDRHLNNTGSLTQLKTNKWSGL